MNVVRHVGAMLLLTTVAVSAVAVDVTAAAAFGDGSGSTPDRTVGAPRTTYHRTNSSFKMWLSEDDDRLYLGGSSGVRIHDLDGEFVKTLDLAVDIPVHRLMLSSGDSTFWGADGDSFVGLRTSDGAEVDRLTYVDMCPHLAHQHGRLLVQIVDPTCGNTSADIHVTNLDTRATESITGLPGGLSLTPAVTEPAAVVSFYDQDREGHTIFTLGYHDATPVLYDVREFDEAVRAEIHPDATTLTVLPVKADTTTAARRFDLPFFTNERTLSGVGAALGAWSASGSHFVAVEARDGDVTDEIHRFDGDGSASSFSLELDGLEDSGDLALSTDGTRLYAFGRQVEPDEDGLVSVDPNQLAVVDRLGTHRHTLEVQLSGGRDEIYDAVLEVYDADSLELVGDATSSTNTTIIADVWPGRYRLEVHSATTDSPYDFFPEAYDDRPLGDLAASTVVTAPDTAGTTVLDVEVAGLFEDMFDTVFTKDILWLGGHRITRGCNPSDGNTLFCVDDTVTRGQMAAFLVRYLGLTTVDPDVEFSDTRGHLFERDIARLATAGITRGCNHDGTRFCPDDEITREQMAAFLSRALSLPLPGDAPTFDDTTGSQFEAAIRRLAAASITRGCNPPANTRFCPTDSVTRGQMAAFLERSDDWVTAAG